MSTSPMFRLLRLAEGPARQNAIGALVIQGSQRLSRLLAVIAAAAVLAPPKFASLVFAWALTDLVRGALQAFDVAAVRAIARGGNAPPIVQASLDAKALAGGGGLMLVAALALIIGDTAALWLVVISGVGVIAGAFATSFLVRRQAVLDLRPAAPRVAAAAFAGTALAVAFVWRFESPAGAAAGLAMGDALLLIAVCGAHGWQWPNRETAMGEIRATGRLLIVQLAHIAQFRVGTIVLAAFGTSVAVAEYSIASRVTEGLVVFAAALTSSSLPLMGAAHAHDEPAGLASVFGRSYDVGLRVVAPLIGVLTVTAPIWLDILFPRYPGAGIPAGIVGLAVMVFFASSQTTALLNATHSDRTASRAAIAGILTSALGAIPLVRYGAVGVAWARVAGELVRLALEAGAVRAERGIKASALWRPWISVSPIVGGGLLALWANWQAPYTWIGGFLVLVGAGSLLGALRRTSAGPH